MDARGGGCIRYQACRYSRVGPSNEAVTESVDGMTKGARGGKYA